MFNRFRIVFVAPYYPPYGAGGAERTTELHARALVDLGYSITIVTPNYGNLLSNDFENIDVIRFSCRGILKQGQQVTARTFYNPLIHNQVVRAIIENINLDEIYCIHAQHSLLLQGAALASKKLNVPLIAHIRDTGLLCSLGSPCLMEKEIHSPPPYCSTIKHMECYKNRWASPYEKRYSKLSKSYGLMRATIPYLIYLGRRKCLNQARKIVFASQGLLNLYASVTELSDRKRLSVVYAIADKINEKNIKEDLVPERIRNLKKDGSPLILYVGKVSKGKGADVLFKAHKKLIKKIPNAQLVICGNITKEDWDYSHSNTTLLGFVSQDILAALYSFCDLVVLPSTWPEPLGWSTIDAGRYKKPIVATCVGGVPEAIKDGKSGFLVEKLDAAGIEKAMSYLINNPIEAKNMGLSAYKYIFEKFSKKAVMKQLDNLYSKL
jgi:glycosyltransferase involved in cell wall biosynthesis